MENEQEREFNFEDSKFSGKDCYVDEEDDTFLEIHLDPMEKVQDDEELARRALVTLCELHRSKVWFDERTTNTICTASLHLASRIMIAALSFLLDYEKIENDDDSDDSDSDDELTESPRRLFTRRRFRLFIMIRSWVL
ncbi:hypothetical protein RJT34_30206 [Clitoria ternatea]|uniref:Protein SDA1 n=1 Tax=Clitoria ternatea TaxID=43366 RepID=A0AAN9I2F2_CLITE